MVEIKKILTASVRRLFPEFRGDVEVVVNKNLDLGDYASPVAFAIAKQLHHSPRDIAQQVCHDVYATVGSKIEVTVADNAPFLNFHLSSEAWQEILQQKTTDKVDTLAGQKINVEFISANPTGPLTLANGRGGYSGDALARVLTFAGADVSREYYVNDTGNQVAQLGKSILAIQKNETIDDGYKGAYVEELAKHIEGDDPKTVGKKAAEFILNNWIKPVIHDRMNIALDTFFSEAAMEDSGKIKEMLERLQHHNLVFEHEGALWLKTTQLGDDKDRVIQRSDGTHTYLLSDITYHWDKIERGFDTMVTMVGADHFSEAKTLDMVVQQVLVSWAKRKIRFDQPVLQLVRLIENGHEVRMSKRAGNFVTLDDLLDMVNSDVARFFFVWHSYRQAMDFDLTLAKETSDQNPVYYIQYAYVRAKHILEKSQKEAGTIQGDLQEEERRLLLHISDFSKTIDDIIATKEVHYLAHYAIELARLFHSFYAKHPVLKASDEMRGQRLALTKLTFETLERVLHLIGVSQPERMVAADMSNV